MPHQLKSLLLLTAFATIVFATVLHAANLRTTVSAIDPGSLAVFPAPDDSHFLTLNQGGARWWQSEAGKILQTVTLPNGSPIAATSNSLFSTDGTVVFTATDSQLVRIQIDEASPKVSSISLQSIDRLILDPSSNKLIAVDHDLDARLNRIYSVEPNTLDLTPLPDLPITQVDPEDETQQTSEETQVNYRPLLNILPGPTDTLYYDNVEQGMGLTQRTLTQTATPENLSYKDRNFDGLLTRYIWDFRSSYAAPGGVLLNLFQPYNGSHDNGSIAFVNPETLESEKIIFLETTSYPFAQAEEFVGPLQLAAGHHYHAGTNCALVIEGTRVFVVDLTSKEIKADTDLRHFGMAKEGSSAAFSADGKSIFLSDNSRFVRCDIATDNLTANYLEHPALRIQKIALNFDKTGYLALDNKNQIWNIALDAKGTRTSMLSDEQRSFHLQGETFNIATLVEPVYVDTAALLFWPADLYPDTRPIAYDQKLPKLANANNLALSFSPGGSYVFAAHETGSLIDALTGKTVFTVPSDSAVHTPAQSTNISHLGAIDQNEAFLSVFGNQQLSTFDFYSNEKTWSHDIPTHRRAFPLFYNYDNQLLVALTNPFELIHYDAETGATTPVASDIFSSPHAADPIHLQVSQDRRHLIYADTANETHIIDLDTGTLLSTFPIAAQQTAFAFSPNADFLLAATSSGPIEFYSLKENRFVAELTAFETSDSWAIMTSDQQFDYSPNLANAIYSVVDGQIIPSNQLMEKLHQPGLLGKLLGGDLPSAAAFNIEGLAALPQVSLALADGTRGLTVEDDLELDTEQTTTTLTLRASGSGLLTAEPRLYHNGKLLGDSTRGLTVEDDDEDSETYLSQNYTVPLLPGENRFRAVVLTANGIESFPATLTLNAIGTAHEKASAGITLHALIIGANKYQNPKYDLNYAAADAEAFAQSLKAKTQNIFTKVQTTLLLDADATRSNILASFKEMLPSIQPRDVFIFYYAGHGVVDESEQKRFYLAPTNVTQLYGDATHLSQNGISADELRQLSADVLAQKQLFLIDACQSSEALVTIAQRGAAEEKAIAQLARSTGTHWLTASGSQQFATEVEELGHGLFTYALLQALEGAADSGDQRISVNELKAYLESQVPQLSQTHRGSAQYPSSYGTGQDFPIAIP